MLQSRINELRERPILPLLVIDSMPLGQIRLSLVYSRQQKLGTINLVVRVAKKLGLAEQDLNMGLHATAKQGTPPALSRYFEAKLSSGTPGAFILLILRVLALMA